jgi:hypothetical protein
VLTINAYTATVLGLIPASIDTVVLKTLHKLIMGRTDRIMKLNGFLLEELSG